MRSTNRPTWATSPLDRPSVLDVVGRAKYDARAKRKGVSRDEAMKSYIELVHRLKTQEVTA